MCDARPHCRTPDACVAKGAGHCRGCIGAIRMAALLADPERIAARQAKATAARATEEHRAHLSQRIKGQWRKAKFRKAVAARARESVAAFNADPSVRVRSIETQRRRADARAAALVGVPIEHLAEYRNLRGRRFKAAEALAVLRESYPQSFAALEQTSCTLRDLGPAPAIGMPERAAWTQRANAIRSGAPA